MGPAPNLGAAPTRLERSSWSARPSATIAKCRRLARPGLDYLFHDYASTSLEELIGGRAEGWDGAADPITEVARICAEIRDRAIAAVVSTDDYPGSALAAVLAKELGLPGPDPKVNLICQHKYWSRVAQARFAPEAVPPFWPIDVADNADSPAGSPFRCSSSR